MSGTKRSYESGSTKRKKRAAQEAFIASQKGALLNFVERSSATASKNASSQKAKSIDADAAGIGASSGCTTETHAGISQNQALVAGLVDIQSDSGAARLVEQSKSLETQDDVAVDEENSKLQTDHSESQQSGFLKEQEDIAVSESENAGTASEDRQLSPGDNQEDADVHVIVENNDTDTAARTICFHWKDPGLWPLSISASERVFLVEKGPFRDDEQGKYLPNEHSSEGRHFSVKLFSRKLQNGETVNRTWLIYSKHKNAVFCFCCKLFSDMKIKLTSDGNSDWINMSRILREHESSPKHMNAVRAWHELAVRLKRGETIDSEYQKLMQRECDHWNKVLQRIMSVVQFLGQRNLAFRGISSRLWDSNNGNFLGLIELLAKYDPCLQEHLRRIINEEIQDHYLGNHIQNELIHLIGEAILKKIIADTQVAKYYSIMLDCTPDTSHQEQMTMIIRIVNTEARPVEICEHFVGFLPVESRTGMSLTETCLKKLEELHLELQNCRGQGYDNGANMKGRNSGVQKRILELNPKAFYVPCGCHSLNLVLSDMAKSSTVAITLFGILHQIYTLFAASTQRWQILKQHVEKFTVKPI